MQPIGEAAAEPPSRAMQVPNPAEPVTAVPTAKPMAICTTAQVPDFTRSPNIAVLVAQLRIVLN